MALAENYVSEERVVKSVTGKIVLDLRPRNIEKSFHLPRIDQYVKITYDRVEIWYRENDKKATKIIQSSFFIDRTQEGRRSKKLDMTRGYMKDDIKYAIVLLSRVMCLPETMHLHI